MRQRNNGTFAQYNPPGAANGLNAWDFINATATPYLSQRTPGQSPYVPLPLQMQINQHWQLLSISVQAYLGFVVGSAPQSLAGPAVYGKFGKIKAGILSLDQPVTALAPVSVLYNQIPSIALPGDPALISDLWNPAIDEMPPTVPNPTFANSLKPSQLLAVSTSISPPIALDILPGVNPGIAIWLLPSLFGTFKSTLSETDAIGLALFNAQFTVNYDDGIP